MKYAITIRKAADSENGDEIQWSFQCKDSQEFKTVCTALARGVDLFGSPEAALDRALSLQKSA
jgi:hypothetical protein